MHLKTIQIFFIYFSRASSNFCAQTKFAKKIKLKFFLNFALKPIFIPRQIRLRPFWLSVVHIGFIEILIALHTAFGSVTIGTLRGLLYVTNDRTIFLLSVRAPVHFFLGSRILIVNAFYFEICDINFIKLLYL